MKRLFDIFFSGAGLLLLLPLFAVTSVIICLTSKGGVFFRGQRVGLHGKLFRIYKFRSMLPDSEGRGKWNVGEKDPRVTKVGAVLRKTKLDELPQLINVFLGDMSLVGPRPELQFYTNLYTKEERKLLELKPGITDWASLANIRQFEGFTLASDPDSYYLNTVRPLKLRLQDYYRVNRSFLGDIRCIFWTVLKVLTRSQRLPKEIQQIVDEYHQSQCNFESEGEKMPLIPTSEQLAWLIRRHAVELTHRSGGSHIGSVLSVADIIAVLYADVLHYDVNNPKSDKRDRMILSKGHAGVAIYTALAESGFFPLSELDRYYQNGSMLTGHVSHYVPGVDFSTGSLGHGLSAAAGMAYAAKKDGKPHKVYAVLGDGECDEGSVWEAALFANHFRLDNLVLIIDHNQMQSMDFCEKTLELESFSDKWVSFGWNTLKINGNNHEALKEALGSKFDNGKPFVIIADTVKGYGIPFMENDILWHYRFPHPGWEYDLAVTELHKKKPEGVTDPYTPDGIANPQVPDVGADIYNDHTTSATWHPTWKVKEGN